MNELVIIKGKSVVTDSLTVADKFKKQHKHVIEKIENIIRDDEKGRSNFRPSSYINSQNKKQKKYTMDRKSFSILCMSFSGKKALDWKFRFYDAFEAMEKHILNQKNIAWQQARLEGKTTRIDFTDALKHVVDFAEQSGSRNAKMYYTSFTQMIYGLLFNLKSVPKNFRDTLDEKTIKQLQLIEWKASQWIDEAVSHSKDYHAPYYEVKEKVQALVDVIGNIKVYDEIPA